MKKIVTDKGVTISLDDISLNDTECEFVCAIGNDLATSKPIIDMLLDLHIDEVKGQELLKEISLKLQLAVCVGISYARDPLGENDLKEIVDQVKKDFAEAERRHEESKNNLGKINPTMLN